MRDAVEMTVKEKNECFKLQFPQNLLSRIYGEPVESVDPEIEASLMYILYKLSDREREVLMLRYSNHMTLKETGEKFSVSANRIEQIEAKALRKLRHPSRARYLRHGVDGMMKIEIEKVKNMYEARTEMTWDTMLDQPIDELELSVRSYNAIVRRSFGYMTIKDLITIINNNQLNDIRNLGDKSVKEVIIKVIRFGAGPLIREEVLESYVHVK